MHKWPKDAMVGRRRQLVFLSYPDRSHTDRFKRKDNTMAYVISDACTTCGACKEVCPTEAISAGADKYIIDPDTCIDCGLCTGECPVDAISPA